MLYSYFNGLMRSKMASNPVYRPKRSMVIKRKIREARKLRTTKGKRR